MSNTNEQITSYAEDLNILYNLKTSVGLYRQEEARLQAPQEDSAADKTPSEDIKRKIEDQKRRQSLRDEIFQAYDQAIPIAASVQHIDEDSIYAELVAPYSQKLAEYVTLDNIQQEIKLPKGLENLFEATKLQEVNNQIQEIKASLAKLQSTPDKANKRNASGKMTTEEDTLVGRIKAEAIAYLESSSCKLTAEEKMRQIKIVQNAQNFVIKRKNNVCTFNCDDIADGSQPRFKLATTIDGASYGDNNNTSGFGKLTADDVRELAALKKPKSFKTKALTKEEQSAKRAVKAALDKQDKLKDLEKLKQRTKDSYKNMVTHADNKTLFKALAVDPTLGKKLMKMIAPHEDLSAEQDKMRSEIFDKALWRDSIWSLYKTPNKKKYNKDEQKEDQKESYYDALPEKICPMTQIRKQIYDFTDNYQDKQDTSQVVAEIAGMQLPIEVAKDMFLQGVFEYGMSTLYDQSFDEQRFAKMNNVLDKYGYQIRFESFVAERKCPEDGAQKVSAAVLNDMHKPHGSQEQQNKIIGLMAQFGSELLNNPNRDFSSTLRATELYENYTQVLFGKADKTHFKYAESWKTFAADEQNRRIAKVIAQEIAKARHQKNPEKPNIAVPVKTLLWGMSLSGSSYHHIFERKFAALFLQTDKFNYSDNLVYTMRLHPADKSDPHREAHKFDTKELYYWRTEDGLIHQGTALRIPEGAEVLRPALYKKDENGQYKPVIAYDTLMVTSSGESISWPNIPGYHGQTKYFSNQNKAQQAPNIAHNNDGHDR